MAIRFGYSESSKGYGLYAINTKKLFMRRDIVFDEGQKWSWRNETVDNSENEISSNDDQLQFDDNDSVDSKEESLAIKGTRTLQDIYSSCNVAILDSSSFTKANFNSN